MLRGPNRKVCPTYVPFVILLVFSARLCNSFTMSRNQARKTDQSLHMAISVPLKDPKLEFGWLGKLAFSLLPLTPESVGRRKTILTEVVRGEVWTLDQVVIAAAYMSIFNERSTSMTPLSTPCDFHLILMYIPDLGSRYYKRQCSCKIYCYSP